MTTDRLRKKFLSFFEKKGHAIVESDSLIPKHDPTLLFTGAGMNQFKDQFMGRNVTYKRAATAQKCLRTADLDKVGKTASHHTFFEMLGNFSFGDYFKKDAIAWAWELLTEVYGIKKDMLYVTVFEGDEEDKIPMDTEALNFWKNHIAEDRILKGNKKDNFWEMGEQGPCGP